MNENKHDASSICVVCSWKSRVSVTWPPWRHNKTTDPHGSVTTWTKLNRKWSGKSVLKHAERVCCSWLQWKVDKGVFFPCFSLNFVFVFKWSQKTTVANGNESMRKKWEPKHHDVLCSKHFQKNASQIAPCWAFSLGSNTCPQVTDSERFPVRISRIANSWAFVYFPLVIPSFSSLVRCVAFRSFSFCLLQLSQQARPHQGACLLLGVLFYFPSLSVFVSSYVKMNKFCSF